MECGFVIEGILEGGLNVICCVLSLLKKFEVNVVIENDLMEVMDWINFFVFVVSEENVVGG